MGRNKRYPCEDNTVANGSTVDSRDSNKKTPNWAALRRLGYGKRICTSCNARNPSDASKCRKCGSTGLRRKSHDFADE